MFGVIALLKNSLFISKKVSHGRQHDILQNAHVLVGCHDALDLEKPSNARRRQASPYMISPSPCFTVPRKQFRLCRSPGFLRTNLTPSEAWKLNFDSSVHHGPQHTTPICHCPVPVGLVKL
eukprot:scpid83376/ scgid13339/ 